MRKTEIISYIHGQTGEKLATISNVVDCLFDLIRFELRKGEEFPVASFGKFSVKTRAAHTGRNPRTGEPVKIPETRTVVFSPSSALKELVNEPLKSENAKKKGK